MSPNGAARRLIDAATAEGWRAVPTRNGAMLRHPRAGGRIRFGDFVADRRPRRAPR